MFLLYSLFIRVYTLLIYAASVFNPKAKLWIDGRKRIFEKIKEQVGSGHRIIWMHCASLGEFEQGRPLLEELKLKYKNHKLLLTFFSPSGYEVRKDYQGVDWIFYLPADTRYNAFTFLELVKPELVFFVKYEFWFNYMNELKRKNIPFYLVSGIFRPQHYFFKWYGSWFLSRLKQFHHFFVQDKKSFDLLSSKMFKNVTVVGDTRFDRVNTIAKASVPIKLIDDFCQTQKVIVAGSTWLPDEKLLVNYIRKKENKNIKWILVPHEVNEAHLADLEQMLKGIRFSRYSNYSFGDDVRVLIVDKIGMLSSLYAKAYFAYVGGGFGVAVHNTLEAAVYGCPVVFGPAYQKFNEAKDLVALGGAMVIHSQDELDAVFDKLLIEVDLVSKAGKINKDYVGANIGATQKILSSTFIKLPLST